MIDRVMIGLAAGAAALCVASAAAAKDYDVPVRPPAGSVIRFVLDEDSDGVAKTATFEMRPTATPGGYRVALKLISLKLPPGLDDAVHLREIARKSMISDVTFDADRTMKPLRLNLGGDFTSRLVTIYEAETHETLPPEARAMVGQIMGPLAQGLTPEAGAQSMLEHFQLVADAQGVALDLGKPTTVQVMMPNPLAPTPLKVGRTFALKSVDAAAGRASVSMREVIDPNALGTFSREAAGGIGNALGKATGQRHVGAKTRQALRGINATVVTACDYQMDLATGLAAKADCQRTSTISFGTAPPQTKIERFAITQALVAL